MKVKKEVHMMVSIAKKVCMDLMARGREIIR
jgi:hypothetical protein